MLKHRVALLLAVATSVAPPKMSVAQVYPDLTPWTRAVYVIARRAAERVERKLNPGWYLVQFNIEPDGRTDRFAFSVIVRTRFNTRSSLEHLRLPGFRRRRTAKPMRLLFQSVSSQHDGRTGVARDSGDFANAGSSANGPCRVRSSLRSRP